MKKLAEELARDQYTPEALKRRRMQALGYKEAK